MNVQVRAPEYSTTGLLPDFIEYHRVLGFEESNIVWESITGDKAVVLASPPKWILCFYPKGTFGVPLSCFFRALCEDGARRSTRLRIATRSLLGV